MIASRLGRRELISKHEWMRCHALFTREGCAASPTRTIFEFSQTRSSGISFETVTRADTVLTSSSIFRNLWRALEARRGSRGILYEQDILWLKSCHVKLIVFDWVFTPIFVFGTEFSFVIVGHSRGEVVFCVLVSMSLQPKF